MESIPCVEQSNKVETDLSDVKSVCQDVKVNCDNAAICEMAIANDIICNKSPNEHENRVIDYKTKTGESANEIISDENNKSQTYSTANIEVTAEELSLNVNVLPELNEKVDQATCSNSKNVVSNDLDDSESLVEEYLDEEYLEYETAEGECMSGYGDSALREIIPSEDSEDDESDTSPVMAYLEKTENLSFYQSCNESLTGNMAADAIQATPLIQRKQKANSNGFFTPKAFIDCRLISNSANTSVKYSKDLKTFSRLKNTSEGDSYSEFTVKPHLEVSRKDESTAKRSRKQRLEPANVEVVFEVEKLVPEEVITGKSGKRVGRPKKSGIKTKKKLTRKKAEKNVEDTPDLTPQRQSKRLSSKVFKKRVCKIASCNCEFEHINKENEEDESVVSEEATEDFENISDYSDEWQLPTKPSPVIPLVPKIRVYTNARKRQLSHKSTYDEDDELSNDLLNLIKEDEKSDKEIDLSKIYPEDSVGSTPTKRSRVNHSGEHSIKSIKNNLAPDNKSNKNAQKSRKSIKSNASLNKSKESTLLNNNTDLLNDVLVVEGVDVDNFEGFESNKTAVTKLTSPIKTKHCSADTLSQYFSKDSVKIKTKPIENYCLTCKKQFKTKTRYRLHQETHKTSAKQKTSKILLNLSNSSVLRSGRRRKLGIDNLTSRYLSVKIAKKMSQISNKLTPKLNSKNVPQSKISSQKRTTHKCTNCSRIFLNNILLKEHETGCNGKSSIKNMQPKNKVNSFLNQLNSLENAVLNKKNQSEIKLNNKENKKTVDEQMATKKKISLKNEAPGVLKKKITNSRLSRMPNNNSQDGKNISTTNRKQTENTLKSKETSLSSEMKTVITNENSNITSPKSNKLKTLNSNYNDINAANVKDSNSEENSVNQAILKKSDLKQSLNEENIKKSLSPRKKVNKTAESSEKRDNFLENSIHSIRKSTRIKTEKNEGDIDLSPTSNTKRSPRNSPHNKPAAASGKNVISSTKNTNNPKILGNKTRNSFAKPLIANRASIYRNHSIRKSISAKKTLSSPVNIRRSLLPSSMGKQLKKPPITSKTIIDSSAKENFRRTPRRLSLKNTPANLVKTPPNSSCNSNNTLSKKKSAKKSFKMPAAHSGVPISSKLRNAYAKIRADVVNINNENNT